MRRLSGLIAIIALLFAVAARAEDKVVEGKGEAAIVNNDEPMAKERATKAALRDAIERTLGTYVVAESQTKDFQLVKDKILSASEGYVLSYDVLDAKKDGEVMVVRVRATIAQGKIHDDLAAKRLTIRQMSYPRMAIMIAEQNIGQSAPAVWWGQATGVVAVDERIVENELIDEWKNVGFTFVDMDALAGKLRATRVVSTNPSQEEVRTIANLSDADVIIVGTAVASLQGDLSKELGAKGDVTMKSCKGSISARVFSADSGEILATSGTSQVAFHIDTMVCGRQALISATHEMSDELQGKLIDAWNKRSFGTSRVRLIVKGIEGLRALNSLKEMLASTVRGVQSVDQKTFKDGTADIDIRLDGGDTDAFAGDLDGRAVAGTRIHVVGQTQNTLQILLGK